MDEEYKTVSVRSLDSTLEEIKTYAISEKLNGDQVCDLFRVGDAAGRILRADWFPAQETRQTIDPEIAELPPEKILDHVLGQLYWLAKREHLNGEAVALLIDAGLVALRVLRNDIIPLRRESTSD